MFCKDKYCPQGNRCNLNELGFFGVSALHAVFFSIAMLTSLVAGCFGSQRVQRHRYYGLPIHERVNASETSLPVSLRIEEFDVAPAYDHVRIVYRVSPYELRHYGIRQWVTKPGRLLADELRLYMKMSRSFATVTDEPRPLPDYVIRGNVEVLEEMNKGDKWYARLVMTMNLVRLSDGNTVWAQRFNKIKRVKKRRPRYVVAGLTDLFAEVAEEALKRTVDALENRH